MMKAFISNHYQLLLSLFFAIVVTIFWAGPYVSALVYQEQFQLFLFDNDYFTQRMAVPGGLADYIAEFLTQFNRLYVIGAIIMGALFFTLQRLTFMVFKHMKGHDCWYALTFIPAFLLWMYMGNESVLLSFVIAMVAILLFMLGYTTIAQHPHSLTIRIVYLAIGIPTFYWLFGANIWAGVVFVLFYEWRKTHRLLIALAAFVYTVLTAYCCSWLMTEYPYEQLFLSINYFRYPQGVPYMQLVVMGAFALVPSCCTWLPNMGKNLCHCTHSNPFWRSPAMLLSILIAIIGGIGVVNSFDRLKYDQIEYDYLVRTNQWNAIIRKAEKHPATTPLSVSCVNLALSMTNQLTDRLFEFYQNGVDGLFPPFSRDMTSPIQTSEIFYRIGMINEAERYCFEAQEAIPNARKSGRLTARIAQCNIINGNYKVAAKYLRMLQKTLFYKKWANSQMRFINNDKAVEADAEYGRLRNQRIKNNDYLFSDKEMDQMLGILLVDNKQYNNVMAYEYLIAYELLKRDVQRFMQYYPLGQFMNFARIPNTIQQVLIGVWLQQHGSLEGIPYSVDAQNVEQTVTFIRTYMTNRQDPALTSPPLSHNAWHYIMMEDSKEHRSKSSMKEIY